ncbi:MAG: ERF family protein [Actinomycetes bacterium]
MSESSSPCTLAQRLAAVMGDVPYIQKGGKTQSGPSFRYVKHDDVVALVRPALVKHGVAFLATVRPESVSCTEHGVTKSGSVRYKTTLQLEMTFVNTDDAGDAYSVSFPGEGIDTDDKGSGKALSYAIKNGLLKTFLIESGDEADNEAGEQEAAPRPQAVRHVQRDQQAEQSAKSGNGRINAAAQKRLASLIEQAGRDIGSVLAAAERRHIGGGTLDSLTMPEAAKIAAAMKALIAEPPEDDGPKDDGPGSDPPDDYEPTAHDLAGDDAHEPQEAASAAPAASESPAAPEAAESAADASDDGFAEFDAVLSADAERKRADEFATAEKAGRKATVTPQQLTRLGALGASLEAKGVAESEWRGYLFTEEGVRSRTQLTKAAASRMVERMHRWEVDLQTGVRAAGEARTP